VKDKSYHCETPATTDFPAPLLRVCITRDEEKAWAAARITAIQQAGNRFQVKALVALRSVSYDLIMQKCLTKWYDI